MPWHLPGELRHFKETTMGKTVVMGRKTWEAIGRPLPGRQNIVISRSAGYCAAGCEIAGSLGDALRAAASEEVMIIGGGQLYRQALTLASRMVITVVECAPPADTWFPEWDRSLWRVVQTRDVPAEEDNPFSYRVQELVRL
jgi:dihydrofolate reductase